MTDLSYRFRIESNRDRVVKKVAPLFFWWLRSPGNNDNNAAEVNKDGNVNKNGNNVNNNDFVRPASPYCPKRVESSARLRGS